MKLDAGRDVAGFFMGARVFLTIFITVLPVFGIVLTGFLAERGRFLPAEMGGCLNQFVYWISLPALLFHELANMQAGAVSADFLMGLGVSATLAFVLAMLALHVWPNGLAWRRSGMGALLATFPNSAFVGLPVVALLYPGNATAMLAGSVATVAYTFLLVAADVGLDMSRGALAEGWGGFAGHTGKKMLCNPLLVGTAAGLVVNACGLVMPAPVNVFTSMLKATASPCALFCMGMLLAGQMDLVRDRSLRGPRKPRSPHVTMHLIRLILHPLLVWVVLDQGFGISGALLGASVMQAAMPTGLASYVVAEKQHEFAAEAPGIIMVSTGLAVLTIPAIASVLRVYGLV